MPRIPIAVPAPIHNLSESLNEDVIREMPADAGKMLHEFYPGPGQLALIANADFHRDLTRDFH